MTLPEATSLILHFDIYILIFLYGSDGYRLKQSKDEIVGRYKNKHKSGINLFDIDLSEGSGSDLLEEALKSSSFFSEHKLIICRNTFSKKPHTDLVAGYIDDHKISAAQDITLLIFEQLPEKEMVSKNKELFKTLSAKNNIVRQIEPLQGAELSGWIKNEFVKRECPIKPSVISKLINVAGNDSWSLINEIDKLSAYAQKQGIEEKDISSLVSAKTDLNIFDLIDSIGSKNLKKSTELMYKELSSGRDPHYILTMITYHFRSLLTVAGLIEKGLPHSDISKRSGLHPFVVKKAINFLAKIDVDNLKSRYMNLLEIDIGFKKGDRTIEDYLYKFIQTA